MATGFTTHDRGKLIMACGTGKTFTSLKIAESLATGRKAQPTTVLFLVGILKALEGHSWPAAVGIAVATAVANWAVFAWWLRVPFPTGVLGF